MFSSSRVKLFIVKCCGKNVKCCEIFKKNNKILLKKAFENIIFRIIQVILSNTNIL